MRYDNQILHCIFNIKKSYRMGTISQLSGTWQSCSGGNSSRFTLFFKPHLPQPLLIQSTVNFKRILLRSFERVCRVLMVTLTRVFTTPPPSLYAFVDGVVLGNSTSFFQFMAEIGAAFLAGWRDSTSFHLRGATWLDYWCLLGKLNQIDQETLLWRW